MNPVARKPLRQSWLLVWLASLLLLSVNAASAGVAWTLAALGAGVRGLLQARPRGPAPVWVRTWLAVATLALLCQAAMVVYWHDPWGERHGEFRLLLTALALWAAGAMAPLPRALLAHAASALSAAAWVGLAWVTVAGREAVPSHPIAWAVGMGMVSIWLLAMGLQTGVHPAGQRHWWLAGGLAAVMAVLASRSRGAFGVVLWWAAVGAVVGWRQWRPRGAALGSLGLRRWLGAALAALLLLSLTPVVQRPLQALQEAAFEVRESSQSLTRGADSSVGARLYLWDRSLALIGQSPWLGHGRAARMAHLQAWAEEAQSDVVRQLGHVHNEYLHQWLDHGLPGLLSQLLYIAGLLLVARQLQRAGHGAAALSVTGAVFLHASASLSNVNFAHNYYTSVLSLVLLLSMCMAAPRAAPDAPGPGGLS